MRGLEYPEGSVKSGSKSYLSSRQEPGEEQPFCTCFPTLLIPSSDIPTNGWCQGWRDGGLQSPCPRGKLICLTPKEIHPSSVPKVLQEKHHVFSKNEVSLFSEINSFWRDFVALPWKWGSGVMPSSSRRHHRVYFQPCTLPWDSKTTVTYNPLQSWKATGATTRPLLY